MIQPEDIQRKAENLYPRFLSAWLDGEEFFPKEIRSRKQPDDDPSAAIRAVQRLRHAAKESRGYGFSIEWQERNSRKHGRNRFPHRIVFETQSDFLRFVGKQREFEAFAGAVQKIRTRYPQLVGWIRSNRKRLIASAGDVDGLLLVVDYLCEHPRPEIFARELPLPLDTKFVERNEGILRQWLDCVLHEGIRSDEEHFARRFGLRYAEPHLLVRFLDPGLQHACGSPWPELSLPLHTLAEMPMPHCRVLIVENKVNLLTLPLLRRTLALGGLGNGVVDFRLMRWLTEMPMWYWGDIDTAGLAILARLRSLFPQTKSVMMDAETVACWRETLAETIAGDTIAAPCGLTDAETRAFEICRDDCLRIEQERLPHHFVIEQIHVHLGETCAQQAQSVLGQQMPHFPGQATV